jgi:hypothetical protein
MKSILSLVLVLVLAAGVASAQTTGIAGVV